MYSRRLVQRVAVVICVLALALVAAGCDASSYGDPEPSSSYSGVSSLYR